jgi:hypothetical protein
MMAFGGGVPPPPLQAAVPKTASGTISAATHWRHQR